MNTTQIKCFLALADTLNFTKAARQLYLSQPALSRQISTLEREVNTILFLRTQQSVTLTPAGALLAAELGSIQKDMDDLLARVRTVGQGYSGTLTIGVLEGQWMGEELSSLYRTFMETYPNIDFRITQGSFSALRRQLDSREIDAAITLELDMADRKELATRRLSQDRAVFAISRDHPLAQKERLTLADLSQAVFLVISPDDFRLGSEMIRRSLREFKGDRPQVRYAPNLSTVMLWIEAGLGVGVINSSSSLTRNPGIRLLTEIPLGDASSCLAWRRDNPNPAIPLFDRMVQSWTAP